MKSAIAMALILACAGCRKEPEQLANQGLSSRDNMATENWRNFITQAAGLTEIPFTKLITITSGRKVIPVNSAKSPDKAILDCIAEAIDKSLAQLNKKSSPVHQLRRINEASRYFEDSISEYINALPDFTCEFPKSAGGKVQRSGYPDLKIKHLTSGRICYLDPKLFESSSRQSTFRTFYYQPAERSGKIHHDAHHLLVGIEHDGNAGAWSFTGWQLVDLAGLQLNLKTEFNGSNRDLYRNELILRRSAR